MGEASGSGPSRVLAGHAKNLTGPGCGCRRLGTSSASRHFPRGRHRALPLRAWFRTVVGPAPRVLPLTPQVVFGLSANGRLPIGGASRSDRILLPRASSPPMVSAVSIQPGSIREGRDSFSRFRLRCRKPSNGMIPWSRTVGIQPPALARSNNFRCSPPTAFALAIRNQDRLGHDSACGWFRPDRATFLIRVAVRTRSPPRRHKSHFGGVRPPPGRRVTYALGCSSFRKDGSLPRGRERQFLPTISPDAFLGHPALSRGLLPRPPKRTLPMALFCQRTGSRKAWDRHPVNGKIL